MKKNNVLLLLFAACLSVAEQPAYSQKQVLFEAGGTYFTNNFPNTCNCLNDFAGFTVNTRIMVAPRNDHTFSFEFPLSLRSKINKDLMIRFGIHLPVLFTYNYGPGASGISSPKSIGFTAGAGWGYFYQLAKSRVDELPAYRQSESVNGPEGMVGIRFPVKSITLFKVNNKAVHPSVAIKFTDLFDLDDNRQNIGMLSFLVGFAF